MSTKVRPVIIFPFRVQKKTYENFHNLLEFLNKGPLRRAKYETPVFVVNKQTQQTHYLKQYKMIVDEIKKRFPRSILHVWSVDTCQMWLAGLGYAFKKGTPQDAYWLIPGDFEYAKKRAHTALKSMCKLPEEVLKGSDLAIGEIKVNPDNAKQLIDTYGTYGLLYNWFPGEALQIRDQIKTRKPRTEFFAIKGDKLKYLLGERWFPYEQMLFILLNAVNNKWKVENIRLTGLIDDPNQRENLYGAMEQIERCERALKLYWRQCHKEKSNWADDYRKLEVYSEEIRRAALTVLSQYLKKAPT